MRAGVAEWQTRRSQTPMPARACEFESHLRHQFELELTRGRLVARSRNPIRVDLRELIERGHELIVGHLQGKPVICSTCAEPAVTVVYPDAPMCAEHAQ